MTILDFYTVHTAPSPPTRALLLDFTSLSVLRSFPGSLPKLSLRHARTKPVSHEALFIVFFARDSKHTSFSYSPLFSCLHRGEYLYVPISSFETHATRGGGI